MPDTPENETDAGPTIGVSVGRGTGRWKLGCAGVLGAFLTVLFGIAYLYFCMPAWTGTAADLMAGGMVTPDDAEVAITPYTPTASATEYAALSGRGEGLDCSIPRIIERRAFPGNQVSLAYRQACVAHDYCYRHGAATYGYAQADCDAALARATLRICRNSSIDTERADCVRRARRVYAGLMAGGAGSFRPAKPDALLAPISYSRKQEEDCFRGVKINAAYRAWGGRLASYIHDGCALSTALAGQYDRLDQRVLDQVLQAWLDMASVAGEYDPYPLGTARLSVPRLARNVAGGTSLFFYMQRPGGAQLREFRWRKPVPGQAQTACDVTQCGGSNGLMAISTGWDAVPSAPWVATPNVGGPGLLWWRRLFTNRSTTGGNVGRLRSVVPKDPRDPPSWRLAPLQQWEPNAPNPYFVTGPGGDERLAAFYYDSCPLDSPRRLVLTQLRIPGLLIQILENLFENSVYWLKVEQRRRRGFEAGIEISLDPRSRELTFSDTGPGVDPRRAEEVFEAFVTAKPPGQGRGLGLYISREMAQYHDWALSLDTDELNEDGRTSTFILELGDGT